MHNLSAPALGQGTTSPSVSPTILQLVGELARLIPGVGSGFQLLVVLCVLLIAAFLALMSEGQTPNRAFRYVLLVTIVGLAVLAAYVPPPSQRVEWQGVARVAGTNTAIENADFYVDSGLVLPETERRQRTSPTGVAKFSWDMRLLNKDVQISIDHPDFELLELKLKISHGASERFNLKRKLAKEASSTYSSSSGSPAQSKVTILGNPASENFTLLIPEGQVIELKGSFRNFIFGPGGAGPVGETDPVPRTITARSRLEFEKSNDLAGPAVRIHVDRDKPDGGMVYVIRRPLNDVTNIADVLQRANQGL